MKAIQVRYLPATGIKGSRVKAWAEGVPAIIRSYDHAEDDGGKRNAAQELANKYGWLARAHLVNGALPNGDEVFVLVNNA